MSESTTVATVEQQIDKIRDTVADYHHRAAELDPFRRALLLAGAVEQLEEMVTSDMVAKIKKLEGKSIGYLVDKIYPEGVIKRCFIEATLYGAMPVNNEWNVIGGRPYFTKNFYLRMCRQFPGVSDIEIIHGVPEIGDEGVAVVDSRVVWKQEGQPCEVRRELAIRANKGMGPDGIIGKAERKIAKIAYEKMLGMEGPPDGDLTDEGVIHVESKPAKPTSPAKPKLAKTDEPVAPAAINPFPPEGKASQDQLIALGRLRKMLAIDAEKWSAIIGKRGVTSAYELSVNQAHSLIAKLRELAAKKAGEEAAAAGGDPENPF